MKVKTWTLKQAQDLVAALRPSINGFGYEVALGGGVISKGTSKNDIDLFMVPKNDIVDLQPIEMLLWLGGRLGLGKTIVPAKTTLHHNTQAVIADPTERAAAASGKSRFLHKIRFDMGGRKVDVFVTL